jgi:hypothetical protein
MPKDLWKKWENSSAMRLDLRSRPKKDVKNGILLSPEERYKNILLRFRDMAEVLALLFKIYKNNKPLYGDRFLAFVGNDFLRNWPWKDFQFTSVEAQKLIKADATGKYNFELPRGVVLSGIRYEHWTPNTFFRDIFETEETLSEDDFYQLLIENYRIVRITKEEDRKLEILGYRTSRPVTAYKEAGIDIYENNLWNKTFSF